MEDEIELHLEEVASLAPDPVTGKFRRCVSDVPPPLEVQVASFDPSSLFPGLRTIPQPETVPAAV